MKFMRFLFVQLALALFQIDLAVKQEIEQLPEQEEEHLIPGRCCGNQESPQSWDGWRQGRGTYGVDH